MMNAIKHIAFFAMLIISTCFSLLNPIESLLDVMLQHTRVAKIQIKCACCIIFFLCCFTKQMISNRKWNGHLQTHSICVQMSLNSKFVLNHIFKFYSTIVNEHILFAILNILVLHVMFAKNIMFQHFVFNQRLIVK